MPRQELEVCLWKEIYVRNVELCRKTFGEEEVPNIMKQCAPCDGYNLACNMYAVEIDF
ncbi:hypothetical protein ES708_17894 [subsurface metagenome]